ncbi:hypothetical protein [Actinacidiphila sp. bgisy160]|uniref:hypothetical protein n=1 Tax=Actinacidiphila sp. bgisy160 TaxID=3413796 RepID=UPI003D70327D
MSSRTAPSRALLPLVALFCVGYLAPYLMPTVVGRLATGLALSGSQAGAVGSALLLGSACAEFTPASPVDRTGRARPARYGLLVIAGGFATAAVTGHGPLAARRRAAHRAGPGCRFRKPGPGAAAVRRAAAVVARSGVGRAA